MPTAYTIDTSSRLKQAPSGPKRPTSLSSNLDTPTSGAIPFSSPSILLSSSPPDSIESGFSSPGSPGSLSPTSESGGPFRRASSPSTRDLLHYCSECKFFCETEERYQAHLKEPRHVNQYRNRAYQDPKKRQLWLKVWISTLEAAEEANQWAFEVAEGEEEALEAESFSKKLDSEVKIKKKVKVRNSAKKVSSEATLITTKTDGNAKTIVKKSTEVKKVKKVKKATT